MLCIIDPTDCQIGTSADFLPVSFAAMCWGNSASALPAVLSSITRSCLSLCGGLAQLGEHDVRNVGVGGSSPLPSTTIVDTALRFEIHGVALIA